MKSIMKVGAGIAMVGTLVLPLLAGAQPVLGQPITGYSSIITWITTAGNWFFGILVALAVIFILYAAFLYLTSGGDEEKVKKAKSYLVYAIIAVAIGLLARGIVYLVATTFFRQTIVQ
ncbi:hypothetical protein COX26_00085 [Candidatus Jorgensenbacteria bacterium CG23_combo_of_CG06-09_8_20_14_all_54_14]|uniref:Uncharacterized protein n=1 Tax=Candidatus Jorgensenbacteria bacterium CG23_combo_of_CG06-09_8_20_14_all_54_14 TaxID=1974595 RepID=A0A2G9ZC67_9BACT|nr:MAG: hypothetical protein COX26_00085 [Candidatus Jorgensenbacteria bacterium CG23_combo_of_CG06-09_8_20_14_all_54_14]